MTRKEYQEHFGVSRQAVSNAVQRKQLETVKILIPTYTEVLVVPDEKYNKVKSNLLTEVHGETKL